MDTATHLPEAQRIAALERENAHLRAEIEQLRQSLSAATDHHRTAEMLQRQAEELARSNKELEQFAYVASHDLQEPLRMVVSYLQLIERRYKGKLDADADDFIGFAVDGSRRMQRLINDLLTYSRVGRSGVKVGAVDCNQVVDRVIEDLAASVRETGALVTRETLPTVRGDASQLGQVFQNLIGNGLKFRRALPPTVHISVQEHPREWVFRVQDNGIGIEGEYTDRIFSLFQRLHGRGEYPGSGIGLALCRKIVEWHQGRIWVESTPGSGSTFLFTLPKMRPEGAA